MKMELDIIQQTVDTVQYIDTLFVEKTIERVTNNQNGQIDKGTLTLILGILSPIFAIIGGVFTWFLKSRKEELQAIEARARESRVETYNKLLEPLIVMFSKGANKKQNDNAKNSITSPEYRKAAFSLITFGSDNMVNTYNEMMQFFYSGGGQEEPIKALKHFGSFMLAIRKDLYNNNTKLKTIDTLKFMITDIDKHEHIFEEY